MECLNILLTKYKEENHIFIKGAHIYNSLITEYNNKD